MIWSLLVLLCVISSSTSAIRHHRLDSLLRTSHTHTSILNTDVDTNTNTNTNININAEVSMKLGGIEDDRQISFPTYKEPIIPQQNPYPENMVNKFTKEQYQTFLKQDEEANLKYERPKQGEDDLMKFEKLLDANMKKIKSMQDLYKIKKDKKEPKKGLLLSELHSSLALSQADTITHAISDALSSDSQGDMAVDVDTSVSVDVGVGAAGDAVSLLVGGEEFAGVGTPLTRNGNSNRAFHGRSTVANALVYTIDNTGAWLGANQVRIIYTSGGVGVNQVLVFAGAVSNPHNLPADVDTFTLRHETVGGVLSHTYQVTMTGYNPVTVGLEIEDNHAVVKCCHTSMNDGPNCANLAYKQEVVRSRVNPATNLPYLMFHLETPGGKSAILEYVTGPVPVHRSGAAVTAEAADINLALSHLLRQMEFNLNEHGGYCQTHGGANDVNNWIPLDIIIQRYNTAIQNDAANFQTNYLNYVLSLPSAGTFATNLNTWRFRIFQDLFRWRIRCAHALVFIDLQANIMMPLSAFGALKAAGGGVPNWAGGLAAQNFLIDMFPDNPLDDYQYVHSYVRRAQWVAHQLVTGAGTVIPGAIPAWQLTQFKGWLAALLMTAMHYAQRDCEAARTGAALSPTDSKNHHVNLIKACLEDGARYFPNALTDVFVTWWANAGGGGPNARIAGILALLTQVGGGAVGDYNAVGGGHGAHCIIVAPHLTAAAHFAHQFTANMQFFWPPAFTRNAAWASRYGVTETNLNQGTAGVITSNNYPGPPWQCFTAVANPSTKSPGRNINWGQTALLIESRHQASPINAGLMPTDQIGVGVTNVFPAYDAIRRIADSV